MSPPKTPTAVDLRQVRKLKWEDWSHNKRKAVTIWALIICFLLPGVIVGVGVLLLIPFLVWVWTNYDPETRLKNRG